MASSIEDTLAAVGYVKVIATLTDRVSAAAQSDAQLESSIQGHFTVPNAAQAESLATVASHHASRRFKRPEPLSSRRVRVYRHLGLAVGYVDNTGLASLQTDAQVGKVVKAPELSLIRPVAMQDFRLGSGPTWGIKRMQVDRLWAAGITGKGVLVGHLDTGVDGSHPALKGAIGKFAEFDFAGDLVPGAKPRDSDEHGTHTAGTIAGRPVAKGRFGVAPDAQLASAMVIEGGQVIDRILAGMDWVIGEGARILSMSLGLRGFTPAFQTVIDALRTANVLPIIAVGNEGPNTSRSPGNYANALSVGAMDDNNRVADFSGSQQFNRPINPLCPALVAPGVDVLSCVPGNRYKLMNGSSMATPHVAGLAALLLEAVPAATPEQVEQAIIDSCSRPGTMIEARANHGVPDAVRAYELLKGAPLPAAVAAVSGRRRSGAARKGAVRKAARRPGKKVARRVAASTGRKKVAKRRRA